MKKLLRYIVTALPDTHTVNVIVTMIYSFSRLWYLPNYKNPKSFNEIIISLKLSKNFNYKKASALTCKLGAKNYLLKCYPTLVVPTLEVFASPAEVFEYLRYYSGPPVILKATHSSGDYMIFDPSSSEFDSDCRLRISKWFNVNYFKLSREPNYRSLTPLVIVEPLLTSGDGTPLADYKFFVFKGTVRAIQVDLGRFSKHTRAIFDRDWNKLNLVMGYPSAKEEVPKPRNFDALVRVAEKLSQDFDFVRVDFLHSDEMTYLGELTFFPGNGAERFTPLQGDLNLGKLMTDA